MQPKRETRRILIGDFSLWDSFWMFKIIFFGYSLIGLLDYYVGERMDVWTVGEKNDWIISSLPLASVNWHTVSGAPNKSSAKFKDVQKRDAYLHTKDRGAQSFFVTIYLSPNTLRMGLKTIFIPKSSLWHFSQWKFPEATNFMVHKCHKRINKRVYADSGILRRLTTVGGTKTGVKKPPVAKTTIMKAIKKNRQCPERSLIVGK